MTTLRIEGMHCNACIKRVTNALSALPHTRVQEVQLGTATLDSEAAPEQILAAIAKTGFTGHIQS